MTPWPQPNFAVHANAGVRARDLIEHGIEGMLLLGSTEYQQTDWALTQLRIIRRDLTVDQIVEQVRHLVTLANAVAEQEHRFGSGPFIAALDEYRDALHVFATPKPKRGFDDHADDALALTGPPVPDELARKRGGR